MSKVKSHKVYDETFKKNIVDLYNAGQGVTALSREYGLSSTNIYKWIDRYSPIKNTGEEVITNDEVIKLKKQLAQIKEENEILKKAVAIFSKR